jgi:hypothetical protein
VGEHPEDGALREATEELGDVPDMDAAEVFTDEHGGWAYHTVVLDSPERFETSNADREGVRTGWFTAEEIDRLRLHPSFRESWPALRTRLDGDDAEDVSPHPEDAAAGSLAPTWSDTELLEPMAATAAVKATLEKGQKPGGPPPVMDMRRALAAMLARQGVPFDETTWPSMLAGEHAAKAGQTGDGAKARAMIPTVEELIDKGMGAEEAAKEWKRLYNNARFRVRDARLKALKAGQAAVAEDKGHETAKPDVPMDHDDVMAVVDTIAAAVLGDLDNGAVKPTAIYTLDAEQYAAIDAGGKKPGPGGIGPHGRWQDKAALLDPGDRVPVVGVWIQGHKVEFGTVFRPGEDFIPAAAGMPPILVEHQPGDDEAAVEAKAKSIALRWARATQHVPDELKAVQTGFAWLTAANPKDHVWAEQYGIEGFVSAATGGDGTSTFWNHEPSVGTIAHEFGHNVDTRADSTNGRLTGGGPKQVMAGTPSLPIPPASASADTPPAHHAWAQVRVEDGVLADQWGVLLEQEGRTFNEARKAPGDHTILLGDSSTDAEGVPGVPTDYGRASTREDFAESVRLYLKDRQLGRLGFLTPDTSKSETSGPVLRFADMYPERARYLATVFGHDEVTATPWRTRQTAAMLATLKATAKNSEGWEEDPTAEWPTTGELAASFVVPEDVVDAAKAQVVDVLVAEIEDAKAKAAAAEAAAAAKLAAEQKAAEELAAKAKAAADAIAAHLADAAKVTAVVPDKDAVAKIRKRKAWVKWNAKQSKSTPFPATGPEGGYTKADLVAKDKAGGLLAESGGKTTVEFDLLASPGGEKVMRLRAATHSAGTDDGGRAYLTVEVLASDTGFGWVDPLESGNKQRVYLDMIQPGTLVRVDKVGHSPFQAQTIADAYEAEALAALGAQVADAKGLPGGPMPEVAGLTDKQVGAIVAGAQDAYDAALKLSFEHYPLEDTTWAALQADLIGKTVYLKDPADGGIPVSVSNITPSPSGQDAVILLLTSEDGKDAKMLASDIGTLWVAVPGTPESAAVARQDFIVNAVIQALADPGSDADHGAPSSADYSNAKRRKAATWLHAKAEVVHPKAKAQGHKEMQAKANIAAAIAERLNNESDWEAFRAARLAIKSNTQGDFYDKSLPFDLPAWADCTPEQRQGWLDKEVSNRVAQWASSSGDTNPWAVMMQRAIAEEFATGGDWNPHGMSMSTPLAGLGTSYGEAYDAGLGTFYRRVARAMWDNTQAEFAEAGITEVSLFRGMKATGGKTGSWTVPGTHEVTDLMPANSWSSGRGTAEQFSGHGKILVGTFPVSRVLGSARSGYGCWSEWEFVVLNGPGNVTVYNYGDASIPKAN